MKFKKRSQADESQWLSVSDLMSGLMMVFLFISIALMHEANKGRDAAERDKQLAEDQAKKIKDIVAAYRDNQTSIYMALNKEFEKDLDRWQAKIDPKDLTFTFKSPEILFPSGKDQLTPRFKEVLDEFFPRYLAVLKNFRNSITEIRIEGHTDSSWNTSGLPLTAKEIYYNNMNLSQGRTRSVLTYIYDMPKVSKEQDWMKAHIAAVGLSSSRPVYQEDDCNNNYASVIAINGTCTEDKDKSRRVSFRILTNAEQQVQKILASF